VVEVRGESVARDEPLFEVSTDKVDSEVPSPLAGVLTEILVAEGDTVDVGVPLAVIDGAPGAAPPRRRRGSRRPHRTDTAPVAAPAPSPHRPLHRHRPSLTATRRAGGPVGGGAVLSPVVASS